MASPLVQPNPPEQAAARFNRPPRIQRPLPRREIVLPAPPTPSAPPQRNLLVMLLPGLGMFFSMGLMSTLAYSQNRNPLMMLPTGLMGIISLVTSLMMYRQQIVGHRRAMAEQEQRFDRILGLKLEELDKAREEERRIRLDNDPPIERIAQMVDEDDLRLWERRPEDPDFACARIGVGQVWPSVTLKLPDNMDPLAPRYPEVCDIHEKRARLADVPVTVNLRQLGSVGIWGDDRQRVLNAMYAMLCYLIAHHAPHELRIALLCDTPDSAAWDWLKWIRHTESLQPELPGRSVAVGKDAAHALLSDLADIARSRTAEEQKGSASEETPLFPLHYLLIIDQYSLVKDEAAADYILKNARRAGMTVIVIESDPRDVPDVCRASLQFEPAGQAEFATTGPAPLIYRCLPDKLDAHQAGELARRLMNRHQARSTTTVANIPTNVRLVDALFAADDKARVSVDEIMVAEKWARRPAEQTWSILLGWKQNKEAVWLNLLEDRDGPHGLVAGTTGAGKSVLLQSMILSLALTHSPAEINFVLIDFKGGSTAEAFRHLPHTISVITNLQGRLVDRSLAILKAEAGRRQKVLQEAGVKDIATYHARQAGLPPLPRLVIIIDEFAEMAKAMPTFMDEINSLAAIGRSLGMHLILATQKATGVVSDKVWANLKFRVSLRVATASDSRDMLGVPDAALLPSSLPGRGYLRVGSERLELFQSANTAYPYRPGVVAPKEQSAVVVRRAGLGSAPQAAPAEDKTLRAVAGQTELEVLVDRIRQAAQPVPRWPDPLPVTISIEQVWQHYQVTPAWQPAEDGRLVFDSSSRDGLLKVVVGLIDDPYSQTRRPLQLDLKNQHYMIVGGPRSGRSTLLQAIVRSLLVNTTPAELNISLLDFGGQNMVVFQDAPHIANVLNVNTPAHLRRFLGQIGEELDRRARLRAANQLDQLPEALYVIDGFAELKSLFPDEIFVLARVAREGLALNVHLVIATDQVGSIPLGIRGSLLGRLALHLSEATDYLDIVGRVGGTLPEALPGRGLVRERASEPVREFQVALPMGQCEGEDYAPLLESDLFAGLHQTSQALGQSWQGQRPERIQILGSVIGASELACFTKAAPEPHSPLPTLIIGKGDRQLDWIEIDYRFHGPSFLVCGPPQSGKTNLLRAWVWHLCQRYSPEEVQFSLIGLRNRSLNNLSAYPHVQRVVDTEFRLEAALDQLKEEAQRRYEKLKKLAETNSTGDLSELGRELGPVHLVVVDDFDAVRFTRERQSKLMAFARYGRDTRTFLLLAGASSDLLEFGDLLNYLKRGQAAFLLQPGDVEVRVTDVRLSASALRQEYPVGRGYLVLGNKRELVQTVHLPDDYVCGQAAG